MCAGRGPAEMLQLLVRERPATVRSALIRRDSLREAPPFADAAIEHDGDLVIAVELQAEPLVELRLVPRDDHEQLRHGADAKAGHGSRQESRYSPAARRVSAPERRVPAPERRVSAPERAGASPGARESK